MLATDTKYPNTAQVAVATGQRGTLEAQTKNPASDQGHQAIGSGAARRLAGDYDGARMPLPSAPAASASETLSGYTPTGRAGVYRQGNSFADEAGTRGAIQTSGPVGRTAAQAAMAGPSAPSPQPVNSNVAALQRLTGQAPAGATAVPVTQQINAASMLAAGPGANQQALARLQANNATPASGMSASQQLAMPSIKTSANDWERRNNLRNLRVSANSLSNEPRWGGMGSKSPDVQAYLAAVETDNAARQGKNPLAQELLQQQGGIVRAGMQEAGATGRTAMGEAGANARAVMTGDIQRGELALKQETQGIANTAAQQLAQVQQNYLNAKTPQERAQAAQAIRVLTGKDEQPTAPSGYRWAGGGNLQAIPGGPGDKTQQGRPMPTAAASGLLGNRENLRRAENALGLLNGEQLPGGAAGDPNATGIKGYLPNQVLNRVDPKGVDTRAAIADLGSLVIHDRSGAAVTAAEFPRLAPFIPTEKDDPATARKKLDQFVKNYRANIDDTTEFYRQLGYAVPDSEPKGQQTQAPPQGGQQPAGQPQAVQIPQAGEVRQGYVFKGGNPADKANWEPAR